MVWGREPSIMAVLESVMISINKRKENQDFLKGMFTLSIRIFASQFRLLVWWGFIELLCYICLWFNRQISCPDRHSMKSIRILIAILSPETTAEMNVAALSRTVIRQICESYYTYRLAESYINCLFVPERLLSSRRSSVGIYYHFSSQIWKSSYQDSIHVLHKNRSCQSCIQGVSGSVIIQWAMTTHGLHCINIKGTMYSA